MRVFRLVAIISSLVCVSDTISAAQTTQTVKPVVYLGDEYIAPPKDASPYISPSHAVSVSKDSSTNFVALIPKGWKVSHWLSSKMDTDLTPNMLPYGNYSKSGEGESQFLWRYNESYGAVAGAGLAVRFDPLIYTNRFERNGGLEGPDLADAGHLYTNAYALPPCTFRRTGYDFAGWDVRIENETIRLADKAEIADGETLGVESDHQLVKFTAAWTEAQVVVALDPNLVGASVLPDEITVTYRAVYPNLPTPTYTSAPASVFDGWFTARNGGSEVRAGQICQEPTNHVLYAKWTRLWSVTFNDSSLFGEQAITNILVRNGGTVDPPSPPVHPGYTFSRWLGWEDMGMSNIGQDRTYTASYEANAYAVRFNKNDGSGETQIQSDFRYGSQQSLARDVFARPGYSFAGWSRERDSETIDFENGALVLNLAESGTVDLYAVWIPVAYSVNFEANGGTGEMPTMSFVYDQVQTLVSNRFVRAGLDFIAWVDPDGIRYADGATVSNLTTLAGHEVVLTALWTETSYVAFDGNGSTNAVPMVVQTFAGPEDVQPLHPNEYMRPGYAFLGWASNRTDAVTRHVAYTNCQAVGGLAAPGMTNWLFAVWSNNSYRVRFDGNGATDGIMDEQTFVYDISQALSPCAFSRDNLKFGGWAWKGAVYADRQIVSNLTEETDGVAILKAIWDVGALSRALKCDNLYWESPGGRPVFPGEWEIRDSGGYDGETCADYATTENFGEMTTVVMTNGVLKFFWKATGVGSLLYLEGLPEGSGGTAKILSEVSATNDWNEVVVELQESKDLPEGLSYPLRLYLGVQDGISAGSGRISNLSWRPVAGSPVPTADDAPQITKVELRDGQLVIESTGDARFRYRVWRTASLLSPIVWDKMDNDQEGQDKGQSFAIPVDPSRPQMFYTVEVLQRK